MAYPPLNSTIYKHSAAVGKVVTINNTQSVTIPKVEGQTQANCENCSFHIGTPYPSWYFTLCKKNWGEQFFSPIPNFWGLPPPNPTAASVQYVKLSMKGNVSESSMPIQVPHYNKMQFEDGGKPFIWKGAKSEEINIINGNQCNEELYPYINRGDISGFRYPQFAVRGTRKIPSSSADTLCGPTECLSGKSITDTGYTYDRINYNWFFGANAYVDFNPIKEGKLPTSLSGSSLFSQEGCATMSDQEGNLLFYTDGDTVYTKDGTIMLNGTDLGSSGTSTQSSIIIPRPESNKYYIFTTDYAGSPHGFEYAIVDMDFEDGAGFVESKQNILIGAPLTEKVTACCHSEEDAYWVIAHTSGDSIFRTYKVSSSGLAAGPITTIGSVHNTARGYMKTSRDNKKLVSLLYDEDIIDIFDFSASAGTLSNFITLTGLTFDVGPYGLEFSSDSSKFYVSDGAGDKVYQFDLSYSASTDIKNHMLTLPTISASTALSATTFSATSLGALQMGPDEKIYIADMGKPYLHVIHYPDGLGVECNLQQEDFILSGTSISGVTSQWGLPNVIPCKDLSCDRYVYVLSDLQLGFIWNFVFNNYNYLLQDEFKKISFIGEIYKYDNTTDTFKDILYNFNISHEVLSKNNTQSITLPINNFPPDVEILIKGYYEYNIDTLISHQLGYKGKSYSSYNSNGELYGRYYPNEDWYAVFVREAQAPLFSNSTPQPPETSNTLVVESQFTVAGVTDYELPTLSDTLVALGGSVLGKGLEYTGITSGTTMQLRLLFEPEPGMVLTFAYISNGGVSDLFADLYQVTDDPIPSGPFNTQGTNRIWFDTTHSKYEFYLQTPPGSDIVLSLNGNVLAPNIDYYRSSSNSYRIIFDGVIKTGDVIQGFYQFTAPAFGPLYTTKFEVPFFLPSAPSSNQGQFTVEFATDKNFDDIVYKFSTTYIANIAAYTIPVLLDGAKAGDVFYYRILNQKFYKPIIGNTICSHAYSNNGIGIEITIRLNSGETY